MAQLERGRGRPVVLPPGEPLAQPHPVLVPHRGRGLVAHPPADRTEPPDKVDVLSYLHVFGEAGTGRLLAHHQRSAGDIGDARSWPDDAGPLAHVKGGTCPLVPRQPGAPGLVRHDARRDRAHRGVGEVRQQPIQPARAGHAVRVEKRHQRCVRRRQAGVPGRRRPAVDRPPQHAGPGRDGGALDRGLVARAVVDHDHARRFGQPGQAAGQLGVPVADRDNHRHLVRAGLGPRLRGVQRGMGDPRVEEAARQRTGLRVVGYRRARPPARDVPGPRCAQPQHPDGVTARDDRPVRQRARPRIGTQAESRRDQLVARSLAGQDHRAAWPSLAASLRHSPRLLRAVRPDPAPSVASVRVVGLTWPHGCIAAGGTRAGDGRPRRPGDRAGRGAVAGCGTPPAAAAGGAGGSLEQHGPHLPLDTDTRIAEAVARRACAGRAGVALAPAFCVGASGEHADFPGTLSIGTEALTGCLIELGRHASLHWPAMLLVNGHGGNAAAVEGGGRPARATKAGPRSPGTPGYQAATRTPAGSRPRSCSRWPPTPWRMDAAEPGEHPADQPDHAGHCASGGCARSAATASSATRPARRRPKVSGSSHGSPGG